MQGLHVVVTGGTGALGSAVVAQLVAAGAEVHIPAFEPDAAALSSHFAFTEHPQVHLRFAQDLSDEQTVVDFYAGAAALSGDAGLWASLHIAGGFAMAPLAETSLAAWQRMMAMNATSAFLCCREASRHMPRGGRLVNVAAKPALRPVAGMVAYSVSKAAVANLTLSLAEELAPRGVWVNAVVPSIMDTPANRAAMPDADHAAWPALSDIANTLFFLASTKNQVTRGALVPVYGAS